MSRYSVPKCPRKRKAAEIEDYEAAGSLKKREQELLKQLEDLGAQSLANMRKQAAANAVEAARSRRALTGVLQTALPDVGEASNDAGSEIWDAVFMDLDDTLRGT